MNSDSSGGDDFEFAALDAAENYRSTIARLFELQIQGDVLELGGGIGQMAQLFSRFPKVQSFTVVEPEAKYCEKIREEMPEITVHQGLLSDLAAAASNPAWDAIVSVNVFEHIEDDVAEFKTCRELLRTRGGALCLLVPARPELYSKIDRDFKHYRRYTRADLSAKLKAAGFQIESIRYFNLIGYFIWLINFRLLGARRFERTGVKFFDQWIFPIAYRIERVLPALRFGQSLIAVARA